MSEIPRLFTLSRSGRRIWQIAAALVVVVAVLAIPLARTAWIGIGLLIHQNDPAVALPDRPPAATGTEADLQDLADLRLLTGFDRSFSPEARQAFVAGIDALAARAGQLTDAERLMEVSRLVALAGNAHTTVDAVQRAALFGRAPVRLAWFADGLYIVRAAGPALDMLGARVAAIQGHEPEAALAAVRPFISGTAELARIDSTPILESPALLQAVWPDTDGAALTLTIDGPDGPVDRSLPALPPVRDREAGQPILAITPLPIPPGWQSVLDRVPRLPLSLQQPERAVFSASLEGNGLYVRINRNSDDADGPLADRLDRVAANMPPGGWRWIVLDLRFNRGGDPETTASFTRRIPDLLTAAGRLWIVTGNATFSAGILTAARALHFAGDRGQVVGEPVGDHARFWSDGGAPLVLRNSGIVIRHAYFAHDWVHGCRSLRDCHPYGWLYSMTVPSLAPEIDVGWRFADYAAGRDTVMEHLRALEGLAPE